MATSGKLTQAKIELEKIRKENGGLLSPEKVVERAKNPKSVLHSWFCWDDTKAANEYRIYQARNLIRQITVEVESQTGEKIEVRGYVSLLDNRDKNLGYMDVTSVMSDDEMRLKYIISVQNEFEAIKNKLQKISVIAYKKADVVSKEIEKARKNAASVMDEKKYNKERVS